MTTCEHEALESGISSVGEECLRCKVCRREFPPMSQARENSSLGARRLEAGIESVQGATVVEI